MGDRSYKYLGWCALCILQEMVGSAHPTTERLAELPAHSVVDGVDLGLVQPDLDDRAVVRDFYMRGTCCPSVPAFPALHLVRRTPALLP